MLAFIILKSDMTKKNLSRFLNRHAAAIILIFLLSLMNSKGNAMLPLAIQQVSNKRPTPAELRFLPPYCRVHQFIDIRNKVAPTPSILAERSRWQKMIGPGFDSLHHYCWALSDIRKANLTPNEKNRTFYLNRAVGDIQYVLDYLNQSDKPMILLPEIHLNKGFALRLLGEDAAAAQEFIAATKVLPSYSPAYGALSDYYRDSGDLEEAKRTLRLGLQHAPNSKLLKRKLAEFDSEEERPKNN